MIFAVVRGGSVGLNHPELMSSSTMGTVTGYVMCYIVLAFYARDKVVTRNPIRLPQLSMLPLPSWIHVDYSTKLYCW